MASEPPVDARTVPARKPLPAGFSIRITYTAGADVNGRVRDVAEKPEIQITDRRNQSFGGPLNYITIDADQWEDVRAAIDDIVVFVRSLPT